MKESERDFSKEEAPPFEWLTRRRTKRSRTEINLPREHVCEEIRVLRSIEREHKETRRREKRKGCSCAERLNAPPAYPVSARQGGTGRNSSFFSGIKANSSRPSAKTGCFIQRTCSFLQLETFFCKILAPE